MTPEEVAEQLSEHQARYIAYSYCMKHQDGRISYPLCFVFISPSGVLGKYTLYILLSLPFAVRHFVSVSLPVHM